MNTTRKKQRGQRRKLASLIKNIDEFRAYEDMTETYEHFHVPCSYDFINSQKTSGRVKTMFCKKWIEATERFINQKPVELAFCKVVSVISVPDFWSSQIIIFYDENYYNSFWGRETSEQLWKQITDKSISFIRGRGIKTRLNEIGYIETIKDEDCIYENAL